MLLDYEQEVWRTIAGYEGKYFISNFGRVKSVFISKDRNLSISKKPVDKVRILKPQLENGYYMIRLCNGAKNTKQYLIHRLIAIAFIPNPENLPIINHKNAIRTDNRIENLEWCTWSHNSKHAWNFHGMKTHPSFIRKHIGHDKINGIRSLRASGVSYRKIAKQVGCDPTTVWNVLKNNFNYSK